jgi:hypothetical protein
VVHGDKDGGSVVNRNGDRGLVVDRFGGCVV